jgi:hypothetical protein
VTGGGALIRADGAYVGEKKGDMEPTLKKRSSMVRENYWKRRE